MFNFRFRLNCDIYPHPIYNVSLNLTNSNCHPKSANKFLQSCSSDPRSVLNSAMCSKFGIVKKLAMKKAKKHWTKYHAHGQGCTDGWFYPRPRF